ncbi:MAG: hypothetical protein A3J68_01510 [Candidatus Wildermuthbacteria bacterium RIFCSPHIGHO2_02_FULL_48_16]|uniref:Peptidoglycan binding-like domain-containing protein n=1 Tax=Candidatus Wildermuthbacteria bacterium RIFCSPHIGHO2_02_FULL_48_16 TaxID=1802453 RepID=A0A1G2R6I5_9BACT|nr:MAG: hypothetical protein A3J68_01510 [Candidatus Wildermuthbacteria bacterium RIFCSPHIGHO2_02_FULL_48_16]
MYIQANLSASNALALLQDVIARILQVQLALKPSVPGSATPPSGSFEVPLTIGSKGADVTALQNFLKAQGADVYPDGLVTGYFGSLTEAAIGRFQLKFGLVSSATDTGYGYVGPKTRAKINELIGAK